MYNLKNTIIFLMQLIVFEIFLNKDVVIYNKYEKKLNLFLLYHQNNIFYL